MADRVIAVRGVRHVCVPLGAASAQRRDGGGPSSGSSGGCVGGLLRTQRASPGPVVRERRAHVDSGWQTRGWAGCAAATTCRSVTKPRCSLRTAFTEPVPRKPRTTQFTKGVYFSGRSGGEFYARRRARSDAGSGIDQARLLVF